MSALRVERHADDVTVRGMAACAVLVGACVEVERPDAESMAESSSADDSGSQATADMETSDVSTEPPADSSLSPKTPAGWTEPERLENGQGYDAMAPRVIVDGANEAVVVWTWAQLDTIELWSRRRATRDGTWSSARQIGASMGGDASNEHQLAADRAGNVVVVWSQHDGARAAVWTNRRRVGAPDWVGAQRLETHAVEHAVAPMVGFDARGNALAVWREWDGTRHELWSAGYHADSDSWMLPRLVQRVDAPWLHDPQLTVDADGNGVVVWAQSDGDRYDLLAKRYVARDLEWGPVVAVEHDDRGFAAWPRLATTPDGVAAVWLQYEGSRHAIWASRWPRVSSLWDRPRRIEAALVDSADRPSLGANARGDTVAVWFQPGEGRPRFWANVRRADDTTWSEPSSIDEHVRDVAMGPRVAVASDGSAIVVWFERDGDRFDVWANRYDAMTMRWGDAQRIEDADGDAVEPDVAVDAKGNAIAVWRQADGERFGVWSSRLVIGRP